MNNKISNGVDLMLASTTAHSQTRPDIAEGGIGAGNIDSAIPASSEKVKHRFFQ